MSQNNKPLCSNCGSLCRSSQPSSQPSTTGGEVKINKKEAIRRIAGYPFAQVREKLLAGGKLSQEVVEEAIDEFRKYLMLITLGHRSVAMTSREVDEVWHTFILFTRDYTSFCNDVFGNYLHHQPSLPSDPLGLESRQSFVEAYRKEFGSLHPIWGINADCSPDTGGGGEECCPDPSCSGDPDPTVVPTHL
jgi:hypothetical protein